MKTFSFWRFVGTSFVVVIRALIVGILTGVALVFNVDYFTDSSYGVMTLVIIVSCFAFFITFAVLFVEIFFWNLRKQRRAKKNAKKNPEK